jgi:uncharacterized membrane protein YdjX (TVP38/TMEM64 family)
VKRSLGTLITISLILAIPIVPFLAFHAQIDQWVDSQIENPSSPVGLLVFGLLSTDIFLPVPSSVVSTLAGGLLSVPAAILVSWMGMNCGAVVGFLLARRFGQAIARKFACRADLQALEAVDARNLTWMLIALRAVPVLAEASVLWVGTYGMRWRTFLPPVVLANFGITLAYVGLGRFAADHQWLPAVLGVSAALPLMLTGMTRSWLRGREPSDVR